MASLADILTSAQNIVQAINAAAQSYLSVQGTKNAAGLTTATLVQSGPGRLCTLSIVVAGSGDGAVYDASTAGATSNPLFTIPHLSIGIIVVNIPVSFGLVVAPGTGQTITVSYS